MILWFVFVYEWSVDNLKCLETSDNGTRNNSQGTEGSLLSYTHLVNNHQCTLATTNYLIQVSSAILCLRMTLQCKIAMPHLVSGMNFLKNFANLLMMGPYHCHLIFLSPVHHHHHHHHHHHFHNASLHLRSTQNSKLTLSMNPSHHSLPHLFGRISRILWLFPDVIAHRFFVLFFFFFFFCLISVID